MRKSLMICMLATSLFAGMVLPFAARSTSAAGVVPAARSAAHPAAFDKTRFVLHLGVAYYAFHHFVYLPYKSGAFQAGAKHRLVSYIKDAAALLFAYHEAKAAYNDAVTSKSVLLRLIVYPLKKVVEGFQAVQAKLLHRQMTDADVNGLNSQATTFQSVARRSGYAFQDQQPSQPIPGT